MTNLILKSKNEPPFPEFLRLVWLCAKDNAKMVRYVKTRRDQLRI
jgi:hypothetical protein